jgi:hypothetical protein
MPEKQMFHAKLPVEDIALLFGIDMAGDKVIMAPIISEDPSYEENELKKYRDLSCMFCNLSPRRPLVLDCFKMEYLVLICI